MILKDFRASLEEVINNSGLSIDMVYFVVKDIMNEITEIYQNQIAQEAQLKAKDNQGNMEENEEKREEN